MGPRPRARRALKLRGVLLALALSPGAAVGQSPTPTVDLDTAVAWAKLLGTVRFFHPSDPAAACDWSAFATATARELSAAGDPAARAALLGRLFEPVAPTLRVFPTGQPAPRVPELAEAGDSLTRWLHHGVGLGFGKIYTSERLDSAALPSAPFLVQETPFEAGARLSASLVLALEEGAEIEVAWAGAQARLTGAGPRRVELRAVKSAPLTVTLRGRGRAWIDGLTTSVRLANPGFEEGEPGRQPPGWTVPYESMRRGYRVDLVRGPSCSEGRQCLQVASLPYAAPPFSSPAEVLSLDLGGGVTAALPLVLPRRNGRTLPDVPTPPACRSAPAADERAERLAVVALAWGVLRHFHPRAAPVEEDKALPAALAGALDAAGDRASFARVLARLAAPFDDPNLLFSHPSAPSAAVPGSWREIAGRVLLAAPEGSGLPAGSELLAIDGRPLAEVLEESIAEVSAPSPAARRLAALDRWRWGAEGTAVRLTIATPAGASREIELSRVGYEELERRIAAERGKVIREVESGVFAVDLRRLDAPALETAAPRLAAARGLVFDLRGDAVVGTELLSHLLDGEAPSGIWEVPVTWLPDRREVHALRTVWTIGPREPRFRGRVAFLLDERSVAFTETLLAIAEHQRLGVLVGTASAGGNGTINRTRLPGGFTLTFTGQSVLKPDGSPHQGVGIRPTVLVAPTREGLTAGRDEVMEAAVRAVR